MRRVTSVEDDDDDDDDERGAAVAEAIVRCSWAVETTSLEGDRENAPHKSVVCCFVGWYRFLCNPTTVICGFLVPRNVQKLRGGGQDYAILDNFLL